MTGLPIFLTNQISRPNISTNQNEMKTHTADDKKHENEANVVPDPETEPG